MKCLMFFCHVVFIIAVDTIAFLSQVLVQGMYFMSSIWDKTIDVSVHKLMLVGAASEQLWGVN